MASGEKEEKKEQVFGKILEEKPVIGQTDFDCVQGWSCVKSRESYETKRTETFKVKNEGVISRNFLPFTFRLTEMHYFF